MVETLDERELERISTCPVGSQNTVQSANRAGNDSRKSSLQHDQRLLPNHSIDLCWVLRISAVSSSPIWTLESSKDGALVLWRTRPLSIIIQSPRLSHPLSRPAGALTQGDRRATVGAKGHRRRLLVENSNETGVQGFGRIEREFVGTLSQGPNLRDSETKPSSYRKNETQAWV